MPNGRPGDSVHHDIVHLGLKVFGPEIDGLVRDVDAHLPEHRRREFLDLIEGWPWWEPGGQPARLDELRERLLGLVEGRLPSAAGVPPAPQPAAEAPPASAPPPPPAGGGGVGIALLGFVLGGVVFGLGAGVAAFVIGDLAGVSQREGAFAMGVVFTLVPLAGLIGGVATAIWLARRGR